MATISIITPAYNAEDYIEDCAKSVLSQTFSDFEWIVVNDGSSDSTAEKLDALSAKDARIKVIHQENKGPAAARNNALDQMQSDYFMFLDCDDLLQPFCLALALEGIEKNNADLLNFGFKNIENDASYADVVQSNAELSRYDFFEDSWSNFISSSRHVPLSLWNKIYRRSLLGDLRFDASLSLAEDSLYSWQVRSVISNLAVIDNPLYCYRKSDTSISRKEMDLKHLSCLKTFYLSLYQNIVLNETLEPQVKVFVLKSLTNEMFKVYISKAKKYSKEVQKQAIEDFKFLQSKGLFSLKVLPIKRKLRVILGKIPFLNKL